MFLCHVNRADLMKFHYLSHTHFPVHTRCTALHTKAEVGSCVSCHVPSGLCGA